MTVCEITRGVEPETDDDVREVKQAIAAAAPLVRARADDADRARALADDVVEALRTTGMNRLFVPAELGGLEAAVVDMMDVVEHLAAVDGSTAWAAMIGAGSNIFAGYLPETGAQRVFADPDQANATMLAPSGTLVPARGAYRLSGRWPFTSNCLHSAWIGLGALVDGEDGIDPVLRVAFVRASDVTIEDTWDSAGLRGTGSHHVVADDVLVDRDHTCIFNGQPWASTCLWRLPLATMFLPLLACVPLGVARGALDEIARQARQGRQARRGQLVDDPIALADVGTVDARLRAARAGLREAVLEAHERAQHRLTIDPTLQARVCLAAQAASDTGVEATSVAHSIGGGDAAYRTSPLLRALADVHASRQHLMLARTHRGELTKALVGLDVHYPPFVVPAADVSRGA